MSLILQAASENKETLDAQVRAWWEERYKIPSMGNPSYEKFSPFQILEHLITMDLIDGKSYTIKGGVLMSEKKANQGYLSGARREKGKGPVVTGDPWIDRMERMVAAGVDPFDEETRRLQGDRDG